VGTIFAATSWEELIDEGRRHQRLRDLPLERYLFETDDGWVLRKARYYRGRIQAEDEEAVGRELLRQLLSQPQWVGANFLLARETVRTIPHGADPDRTRTLRRLAQEIAEKDPSFKRLRVKLHTAPTASDVSEVQAWIVATRKRGGAEEVLGAAEKLVAELAALFGGRGRAKRFAAARKTFSSHPRGAEIGSLLSGVLEAPGRERIARLSALLALVRKSVSSRKDGAENLALLDLSVAAEQELMVASTGVLAEASRSRRQLLRTAKVLADAVYGVGFVTEDERAALAGALERVIGLDRVSAAAYLEMSQALRRASGWALGTVRYTFAESLARYGALESKAARFPDDLLRSSPLLPMAEISRSVSLDAERLAGIEHRIFGTIAAGLLGVNPGLATGRLRVVKERELGAGLRLRREEIVVLPKTVSELDPVAGILTLAEGNLLSHVQILARNLGIPNAVLNPSLADEISAYAGADVVFAVGANGSVVLERLDALPAEAREVLQPPERSEATPKTAKLAAPIPDLRARQPLPLAELHAGLAGKVVGPKAANLGELARLLPGKVAPAVALPFGIFAEHAGAGKDSPRTRLVKAFARHRAGELDASGLTAQVDAVREAVAGLSLSAELRETLLPTMAELFGPPGSYGLFVRSDTNVEDLPGFTGAGLNKTVPNAVGIEKQLAAVPRVWSSPFRRRAMAWREKLLSQPEEVYPSVLLMLSVAAEKSGVLATTDLARRDRGLTVAMAWGVGGAVSNEVAETLVLRDDGSTLVLSGARAPYQRRLRAAGGLEWVPAPLGPVLTASDQAAVRALAAEVLERMKPVLGPDGKPLPWDVEFGIVDGKVQLFQIRPLVERGHTRGQLVVEILAGGGAVQPAAVLLDEPPLR
jgi:hypothetical protein